MTETPYFIDHESAVRIACKTPLHLQIEEVTLEQANGRVLAQDLQSNVDDPPFDNSAMDGFAFIHQDTLEPPTTLTMIQTIQAGESEETQEVQPGQASKIMTCLLYTSDAADE